jgi:hypothetical protein
MAKEGSPAEEKKESKGFEKKEDADEKEPNYGKMSKGALKKYGAKSSEEASEVSKFQQAKKPALDILKKKATE